ncbi:MAG: hypothetical protein HUJ26_20580 [Planctomycetaceae bacterium]|nr:hypothetical protein [Planctomycetaceae bacterium]
MSLIDALQNAGLIDLPADATRPVADFGDPVKEYQAASTSTAIIPEHEFGIITVTGADRAKFLHNFCTQDIKGMQPGDCREAFFCNVKGRILAVAVILCDEDCLYVLTDEDRVEFLRQHLDKYLIMEDVTLSVEDSTEALLVVGKSSVEGANSFTWDNGFRPAVWVIGEGEELVDCVKKMVEESSVIAGHTTWEIVRLSIPFPKYGVDVSDDNLAQEANRTERAISFTKGCYLGQEPIARLDAMGHVNRQLEQFAWSDDSGKPPIVGKPVLNEAGEEVGTVTSACQIPDEDRGFVLAMVKIKELGGILTAENSDDQPVRLQTE